MPSSLLRLQPIHWENWLQVRLIICLSQLILLPNVLFYRSGNGLTYVCTSDHQQNLETLKAQGNLIIDPVAGELASGLEGRGRMEEPENIVRFIQDYFVPQNMLGKKILITAGPTFEKIDPVRFIGNYSSGKMGFALAETCARRGADVILVCGPVHLKTPYKNIERINVDTAADMYKVVMSRFEHVDGAIMCAAVSDFTPVVRD